MFPEDLRDAYEACPEPYRPKVILMFDTTFGPFAPGFLPPTWQELVDEEEEKALDHIDDLTASNFKKSLFSWLASWTPVASNDRIQAVYNFYKAKTEVQPIVAMSTMLHFRVPF